LRCRRRWRRPKGRQKARTRDESIARGARHGAAAPLPRGGVQPRTLRTHGRPSMKRPGDLCHGIDPTERPTTSHARVDMTPSPAASAGMGLMGRGTSNALSTAMRPAQNRAIPDGPRPKLLLTRAIGTLRAGGPFASPFLYRCDRLQRVRTANDSVPAGQSLCGAPRRNRTGDPILTMDRGRTAVLTGVSAACATP
jgi:hypothetical protein